MALSINKSKLTIQLNNILSTIQQELSTLKIIKSNELRKEYASLINQIYLSRVKSYDRLNELSEGNADVVSPPNRQFISPSDLTKKKSGLISALQENNPSKILSNIYHSEANLRAAFVKLDSSISIKSINNKIRSEINLKDQNLSQIERALRTKNIENFNLQ